MPPVLVIQGFLPLPLACLPLNSSLNRPQAHAGFQHKVVEACAAGRLARRQVLGVRTVEPCKIPLWF